MYPRNAASPEPIAIGAVLLTADGTVQTSGVTVRVKPIGVSEADGGGTVAYSTNGVVIYTPTQAETNYTSFVLIATKASCIPASITVVTTASATPGTVRMQSAADNAITFQSINDGAIGTGKMGSNAITSSVIQADAINATKVADGTFTASKFAAGAFDAVWSVAARTLTAFGFSVTVGTNNDKAGYSLTPTTGLGNQTANITGNLTGSVGSVTGAVGSVTGNVGGNVVGSVGSVTGGATATALSDVATEIGKVPKSATALTSGQVRHSIAGGSAANITIGPHV